VILQVSDNLQGCSLRFFFVVNIYWKTLSVAKLDEWVWSNCGLILTGKSEVQYCETNLSQCNCVDRKHYTERLPL
jgi:hypothetical protein